MPYPEGILAVGAILLTLMGGIAGNICTVFFHRIRSDKKQNLTKSDYILLLLLLLFLAIIIGNFLRLLFFVNISTNPIAFFLCVGILFGVIGSIYSNFFSAAFDRYIESRIKDHSFLNRDKRAMALFGGVLAFFIAYLFWMFITFT